MDRSSLAPVRAYARWALALCALSSLAACVPYAGAKHPSPASVNGAVLLYGYVDAAPSPPSYGDVCVNMLLSRAGAPIEKWHVNANRQFSRVIPAGEYTLITMVANTPRGSGSCNGSLIAGAVDTLPIEVGPDETVLLRKHLGYSSESGSIRRILGAAKYSLKSDGAVTIAEKGSAATVISRLGGSASKIAQSSELALLESPGRLRYMKLDNAVPVTGGIPVREAYSQMIEKWWASEWTTATKRLLLSALATR